MKLEDEKQVCTKCLNCSCPTKSPEGVSREYKRWEPLGRKSKTQPPTFSSTFTSTDPTQ